MAKQPTLRERIASADTNMASCDLEVLLREVHAAIATADAEAKQARDKALDLSTTDTREAHLAIVDAEMTAQAFRKALPDLEAKLATVLRHENSCRWHSDADRVQAKIDAAAERLQHTRELVAEIVAT